MTRSWTLLEKWLWRGAVVPGHSGTVGGSEGRKAGWQPRHCTINGVGGGQQDCRGPPVARTPPGPAGQEQPKGGRMWAAPAHPLQQNSCQWFSHLHARCPPHKAEFSEVGTMFRSLYIRCLLYIFKYLTWLAIYCLPVSTFLVWRTLEADWQLDFSYFTANPLIRSLSQFLVHYVSLWAQTSGGKQVCFTYSDQQERWTVEQLAFFT